MPAEPFRPQSAKIKDTFLISKMKMTTGVLQEDTGPAWGMAFKFGTDETPDEEMDLGTRARDTPILFIPQEGLRRLHGAIGRGLEKIARERAKDN